MSRQGNSRRNNSRNNPKKVAQSLTLITQFGINMIVPIFLCSFAGIYLDKWLGTSFFMVGLFFIGAIAGFRNIYIMAKHIYRNNDAGDANKK
ncbi:MAG: AtpZ/AtpI family protein [Lachnospiraceae bacterium]|nr:AtpZ/AtpI family protein [Lachnospiraceae bacterium]